jgi:DnaJ-class molecular chaperone
MKAICPKCEGKQLRPRTKAEDGAEADPDLHPFLSKKPKPCERCGGSGKADLTQEEIAKRTS